MRKIETKKQLQELTEELGVCPDWHEPDEQGVSARVYGMHLDNAGFWGDQRSQYKIHEELHVVLYKNGDPVAAVNLATLFSMAGE